MDNNFNRPEQPENNRQPVSSWQPGQQQPGNNWQAGQQQPGSSWQTGQQQPGNNWQAGQQQPGNNWQAGQQQPGNNWQTGQGQSGNNWQPGQQQPGNTYRPGQPYTGGYRPYTSYQPAPAVTAESFTVSPGERRILRSRYFGVFSKGIVHNIGTVVLANIIFILMTALGYEFRLNEDGFQIMDWKYLLAATLPSVIFCMILFFWDKTKNHIRLGAYFSTGKTSGSDVTGFFGLLLLAFSVGQISQYILLIGCYAFGFTPISLNYSTIPRFDAPYFAVSVIMTVFAGPVAEELMFRGVVLRGLSEVSGRFAIVMSAAMFGLMHGNLTQAFCAFIFGLVLGYAAVRTDSLILPIAGHIMANLVTTTVSFVEYFLGEEVANTYWFAILGLFGVIGLISLIILISKGRIRLPEFTEYHRSRTMPIAVTCISFWVMMVLYIWDIVSKFELVEW